MAVQITTKVRDAVYMRDNGRCVRCGAFGLTNIHHRTPRGMGGTKDKASISLANLLTLCGHGTAGCHGYIESHRAEAVENGYIVLRGTDPATVPVKTLRGEQWFTNDG